MNTPADFIAAKVRAWYEKHRESWWTRHSFDDAERASFDGFMLDLIAEVQRVTREMMPPPPPLPPPLPPMHPPKLYEPMREIKSPPMTPWKPTAVTTGPRPGVKRKKK